jgi:cardiolipin synthase A/B
MHARCQTAMNSSTRFHSQIGSQWANITCRRGAKNNSYAICARILPSVSILDQQSNTPCSQEFVRASPKADFPARDDLALGPWLAWRMVGNRGQARVKLIIQPEDGVVPIVHGIDRAEKSIEIAIFRFDHVAVKRALEKAVARNVSVRALIANTNRGHAEQLRKLEMDLLPAGIEVARTAGDLLRYHYKFMIIDRKVFYLLAFNFTHLDIEKSRSFGIITDNPDIVHEAAKLFEADVKRQPYSPKLDNFVVSPVNARQLLSGFIEGARQELLIYDPEISDRLMIRRLRDRVRAGVEIRIIGRVDKPARTWASHDHMRMRFHTRTIIRDREQAFIGSQSLREAELNERRELGIIVHSHDVVHTLLKVFERDWANANPSRKGQKGVMPVNGGVEKVAKAIVRELPLEPLVAKALKRALRGIPEVPVARNTFKHKVEDALRQAVEDAVSGIVRQTVKVGARM